MEAIGSGADRSCRPQLSRGRREFRTPYRGSARPGLLYALVAPARRGARLAGRRRRELPMHDREGGSGRHAPGYRTPRAEGHAGLAFNYVSAPISHFVPLEVRSIYTLRRFRFLPNLGHWTLVAVGRMKMVVYVPMEVCRAMKPWAGADKDAIDEPLGPIIASRSTSIGRNIMLVPATIDSNLPCTELCIGSDTALNNIVEAVDKIRHTAGATKRAFIVEVMGKECGYLALMGALATGAEKAYLPENGIALPN